MALAILSLLAAVIFVRSREPFEQLVVILELVLGRTAGRYRRSVRQEPPAA